MAGFLPVLNDVVIRSQVSQYAQGWLLLEYARQHDLAHDVVLTQWRKGMLAAFKHSQATVWSVLLDQSRQAFPAPQSLDDAHLASLQHCLAEMARIVRPPFDRVRQWGLGRGLPWREAHLPVQVLYSEAVQWQVTCKAQQYWQVVMPVTAWTNPLAWHLLPAVEPSAFLAEQRGDTLLVALALLSNLSTSDWVDRWVNLFQRNDGSFALPEDNASLSVWQLATLVENAHSGLLFSARPRTLEHIAGSGIAAQLNAMIDEPLTPTEILQVSAHSWLASASSLAARMAQGWLELPLLAQSEAQWLHLTLKSWETAQLHQVLQVAASAEPPAGKAASFAQTMTLPEVSTAR